MTLMELAQSWEHDDDIDANVYGIKTKTCSSRCHRCQLEKWARSESELLKSWQKEGLKVARYSEDLELMLLELGVPEGK